MIEKTEEQIAKERAQVAAMKGAQSAMAAVLERNAHLERALTAARQALISSKRYVSGEVYMWTASSGNQKTVHAWLDAVAEEAAKVLGQ